MKTDTLVLLVIFRVYHIIFIITSMKNVNNFQILKVQPHGVTWHLRDFFCQFQPGVAYKTVGYTKKRVNIFIKIFQEMLWSISEAATFLKNFFRSRHRRCSVKIGVLKSTCV